MSEKRKFQLAIVSLLILGIVWFLWYTLVPTFPLSEKQAYALVARELPIGSSKSEIENWMKSKGLQPEYGDRLQSLSLESDPYKGRPEDMAGYVCCWVFDNTRIFMGNGDLFMVFFFDKDDRLLQFHCHQVYNTM
jgi:hypothetical protein